MTEDLIKRRQLLKEKLEGKSTENLSPSLKQTKVKTNPTRLNIPTIFQLNKSTENLSAGPKLSSQNVNISKSTGNIYKDTSLKLSNFEESPTKAPAKPPRKLSTSFCLKIDNGKSNEDLTSSSQNESKLKFSRSFSVTKSTENIENYNGYDKKDKQISRTKPERMFSFSSDDLDTTLKQDEPEMKINTSPMIVSSIRKKTVEETNKILLDKDKQTNSTNEETVNNTEDGLVMLRKKLSDLRASKINRISAETLPSMNFNFTDQTPPASPILKTLEKHPNLKRSGSRVGFIVREEMNQKEENKYDDEDSLYDNLQLKHIPVKNNEFDKKEKFNNNTDTVDSFYDIEFKNRSLDLLSDKTSENISTNKETDEETKKTDEVLLRCESMEEFEKNNSLYGAIDNLECDKEKMKNELQMKYSNIFNEVLYENMEAIRANNYYSKKFLLGPVHKTPLPTKRTTHFK